MIDLNAYLRAPCRASSLPWWKTHTVTIPGDMMILHGSAFDPALLTRYDDVWHVLRRRMPPDISS